MNNSTTKTKKSNTDKFRHNYDDVFKRIPKRELVDARIIDFLIKK